MEYYTIYKITNQLNNMIYIGAHKTSNLDDSYMGSGYHIKSAIKKYGIENFTKEILYVFNNADEMFEMESTLVNEDFILREDVYNINLGGRCGFDSDAVCKGREATNKILEERWGENWRIEVAKLAAASRTEESYSRAGKKAAQTIIKRYGHGTFYGKTHTDEAKAKIGAAASKREAGKGNSQYGTMWIHSLIEKRSKKIKKGDPIPEGWLKGAKHNFQEKIVICKVCGQENCTNMYICKKMHFINVFVEYFGFDKSTIGTKNVFDEWYRIVKLINTEYFDNKLSTRKIAKKYNFPSSNRIDSIFKAIGLKPRSRKESQKLSFK